MRRGCIGAVAALALLMLILGYAGYRYLSTTLDVPEDLAPWEDPLAAAARVRDTTPAPHGEAHFTEMDLALYVGAFDSLAAGWRPLARAFDSMMRVSGTDSLDTTVSLTNAPDFLRQIALFGPRTHRAFVRYLNDHQLSLARYDWIRERVIAASGLTHRDVEEASRRSMLRGWELPHGVDLGRELFARVERLRLSGVIDSAERALALPRREELLQRGLLSLTNVEGTLTQPRENRLKVRID